jgi:thiamine pyrophosphate-dependent acetolactate synthase large subunit-like protein
VLDFNDTDFAAIAKAIGAHGARVNDSKDLKQAVRDALASKMPALVDVVVSKEAVAPSAGQDLTRKV